MKNFFLFRDKLLITVIVYSLAPVYSCHHNAFSTNSIVVALAKSFLFKHIETHRS